MRYVQIGLGLLFLFCGIFLLSKPGGDFSPRRIQVPLLAEADPVAPISFEWPKKFRFFGRGHQVFAFESEDKQLILKFFDRQQLELHWYARLPFRVSKKKMRRLRERISAYPQSYRLAFEWLRTETALLAVHQGISSRQYPTIDLIGPNGRSYKIDLNETPFILQKKVNSSLPELLKIAKQEGNLKPLLDQFLEIHRQRLSLHIADHDRDIYGNYGWDGKRLIYLDPARFYLDPNLADPLLFKAEWFKVTEPVRKWLLRNASEEIPYFDAKIEQFLDWQKPGLYRKGVCGNDWLFFGARVSGTSRCLRS